MPRARPLAVGTVLQGKDQYQVKRLVDHAFGRRPRARPEPVLEAIHRIWLHTLYEQTAKDAAASGVPFFRQPAEGSGPGPG